MKRLAVALACLPAVAALLLRAAPALAADPSTAECLGASDASLKAANDHKLRAERAALLVCAAPSCPGDIRKECLRRVDEVSAQIPTVVFSARDAAGADLAAVRVTMDGELLAERLEGTAVPVDPGEHVFTFETPGQPAVTKNLVIVEGQRDRQEAVAFGPPAHGSGAGTALAASAPSTAPTEGLGTGRVMALVAGGAGVVGLGVGTVFGLVALSKKSAAQTACPDRCATSTGVTDWNDARSAGNLSTVGFVAGGVLVAAGVVLWLATPPARGEAGAGVAVGIAPGALELRGAW